MTRSTRALAVTAAVAVALSGCGLRERIQPTTTGTSTPASSATTATPWSSATSEDLGTLTGAGRPMDEGELRAALPSAGDLGADWEDDPAKTVSETQAAQVTPSSCAPLLQKGPGWDEVMRTERARAQVNLQRDDNPPPPGTRRDHMAVWAYSFDDPYPTRLFDEAGALIADCPDFDVKQEDTGNTSSYEATPLGFPQLGDRTLALRLTIQQTFETMTIDFVIIKVGHNTVSVANGTYNGTPNVGVTEKAARAAVAGLEEQG
ncbi:hypothetical protein ACTHQ1_13715 [Janibacter anophelis]|uniref:hypothetical protein n=1 Tax=Janibacter anophelis TaxID=319054 RepID=UPI003F7D2042